MKPTPKSELRDDADDELIAALTKWANSGFAFADEQEEEMNDPWKHRSDNMKCKTCMWYVGKEVSPPNSEFVTGSIGRCRRHAPSMNGYPVVFLTDWCGDHKLDEQKL